VDLVPLKTCTYDCIYCQLGRTTHKTTDRKEWAPVKDILEELERKIPASRPDYITLAGSGEPTLFSRMGELIDRIRSITDIPIALLTNGSLLWRPDVRSQLMNVDLVIPSLDAGDETMFRAVNRPHESVSFRTMLSGLVDFRREFGGQYWLEVFLLAGYTAVEAEVAKLAEWARLIEPDRVQLNTVARPPAEDFAVGVARERMVEFASMFDPPAEVIAGSRPPREEVEFSASRGEILEMLRRRPCSIEDIAAGLGMHRHEVLKHIEDLSARRLLRHTLANGILYYATAEQYRRTAIREA
jgi:wyosine [tRNA(Phe)-imidazoG37] synthetase (radical SAM superfamily)